MNYLNKWDLYREWKLELISDVIKLLKNKNKVKKYLKFISLAKVIKSLLKNFIIKKRIARIH